MEVQLMVEFLVHQVLLKLQVMSCALIVLRVRMVMLWLRSVVMVPNEAILESRVNPFLMMDCAYEDFQLVTDIAR